MTSIMCAASETLFTFSQLFGESFFVHVPTTWNYILKHLSPTPNASVICKLFEGITQVPLSTT